MQIEMTTVVIALSSALMGGWAASFFQHRSWKKSAKHSFMWEFRTNLYEAERLMWEAVYPSELNIKLNWLSAAAMDSRINIEVELIEEYKDSLLKGWTDLNNSKEETSERKCWGINKILLDDVDNKRNTIDEILRYKMSRLI